MPSSSHPRELPLDCSHLRLAFADLLLALEMVEVSLPVLPLAVYDLTSSLHEEVIFRLALDHGVAVLHAALLAFDGRCDMLCVFVVGRNAVTLAELLRRVFWHRHGHWKLEDQR